MPHMVLFLKNKKNQPCDLFSKIQTRVDTHRICS